jgi:hypothetical protein
MKNGKEVVHFRYAGRAGRDRALEQALATLAVQ